MVIACIFRHTKSVIFIVFILNCVIIFSNVVSARVTSTTDDLYESGSLPFLNRQKRQTIANCSRNDEFQCKTGDQCIDKYSVCDGTHDCNDKSDETEEVCGSFRCQTFRCVYGDCVNRNAGCNGTVECPDGSDESPSICPKPRPTAGISTPSITTTTTTTTTTRRVPTQTPHTGLLVRTKGSCRIPSNGNGRRIQVRCLEDAQDPVCSAAPGMYVPPTTYIMVNCESGYTLDNDDYEHSICFNEQWNPRPPSCTNPKTVSITKTPFDTAIESSTYKQDVPLAVDGSCHVPPVSPGRMCSIKCRGAISDCSFPGAQLHLSCTCGRNHTLSTKLNEAYCIDGIWFPTVPKCIPLCPILKSTMLNFLGCSNESSCTEPAKPGTIVRIECKPNYTPVDPSSVVRSVKCGDDGMWDSPLYKCRPECGLPFPGVVPLIIGGRPAKPHEAPWHVAVYLKVNSDDEVRYRYICGGTIISPFLIVSAAHCFTNATTNVKLPVENFKIAVAKMTVRYNISDDPETRIFGVTESYIPDNYYGERGSYGSDIALVELDGIINMSNKVMPICIDWSPRANSKPPNIGTIAGWGYTNNESTSDVLLMAQLPFIPQQNCSQMVQPTFGRFIYIADKFCSGSLSGPGARQGDSGGGWMYERNGHYFVYGIVSLKETSSTASVATFTSIPFHLAWMESIKREVELRRGH